MDGSGACLDVLPGQDAELTDIAVAHASEVQLQPGLLQRGDSHDLLEVIPPCNTSVANTACI